MSSSQFRNSTIQTNRLILKEVCRDDVDTIHKIHSIPEVEEFNTLGIPKNLTITKEIIQPYISDQRKKIRTRYCWLVRLTENNEVIGICGMSLSAESFKMGEIFYNVIPEYWGKGYATEIAKAQINYGFNRIKLHRIEAGVATENVRSIRVLEKAGMTREGMHRNILPIRGKWKDNYHYAILKEDKRNY